MKKLTREQAERMSPESRARYEAKLKKVNRNKKILAGFVALVLIAAVCAALSLTVLFNITSVKVTKKSNYYSEQEIISASGLDVGENMLRTDFGGAQERIERMLPYILSAEINKSLSGAVTITVKDNAAAIIFEVKNGYAVADANGKVLEVLKEAPEDTALMVLKASKELTASAGQHIGFADEAEAKLFETICTALKNTGLYGDITSLDISKPTNIKIIYQNRMRIKIGDSLDIEAKLKAAAKAIAEENEINPNTIAEVNATILKKVYVNPLDSLEEKEPDREPEKKPEETTTEETTEESDENDDAEDEEESEDTEDDSDKDTEADEEGEDEEDSDENDENESENEENATEEE